MPTLTPVDNDPFAPPPRHGFAKADADLTMKPIRSDNHCGAH